MAEERSVVGGVRGSVRGGLKGIVKGSVDSMCSERSISKMSGRREELN